MPARANSQPSSTGSVFPRPRRSGGRHAQRRPAKVFCRSNPIRAIADTTGERASPLLGRYARPVERDARHQRRRANIFCFGRDRAFLDVMGHQGNDFQITGSFWKDLNALTAELDKPGEFVCYPRLRMVGQHCRRRRPQRTLPPRGRDHPPLKPRADRRSHRHGRRGRGRPHRRPAFRQAAAARTAW